MNERVCTLPIASSTQNQPCTWSPYFCLVRRLWRIDEDWL